MKIFTPHSVFPLLFGLQQIHCIELIDRLRGFRSDSSCFWPFIFVKIYQNCLGIIDLINKSQFRNKNEPIYFLTYCLETFQATINFVEKNGGNKGIEINLHNYVAWCIIIRDITHVWASSADAPMCWAALASNYSWKA